MKLQKSLIVSAILLLLLSRAGAARAWSPYDTIEPQKEPVRKDSRLDPKTGTPKFKNQAKAGRRGVDQQGNPTVKSAQKSSESPTAVAKKLPTSKVLTAQQIERIDKAQALRKEVENETLERAVARIEKKTDPETEIRYMEAEALTYDEIVRRDKITDQHKKSDLDDLIYIVSSGLINDNELSPHEKTVSTAFDRNLKKVQKEK